MSVTNCPPHRHRKGSYPFNNAQHQTTAQSMSSGAQATTPVAKGTTIKASRGRGPAILRRNDPGHSHYQMTLRSSDFPMAGNSIARETVLHEQTEMFKGNGRPTSLWHVRKTHSARREPQCLQSQANKCIKMIESHKRLTQAMKKALTKNLIDRVMIWKRVPRVKPDRNPAQHGADRFTL